MPLGALDLVIVESLSQAMETEGWKSSVSVMEVCSLSPSALPPGLRSRICAKKLIGDGNGDKKRCIQINSGETLMREQTCQAWSFTQRAGAAFQTQCQMTSKGRND